MEFILPGLALLAGFHSYTYARWLKRRGNNTGWIGVLLLTAAGVGVPLYRFFTAP